MRLLTAFLLLIPGLALAQVSLVSEVFKIVAVTHDNGTVSEQWQAAEKIVPGDKVGYRIRYQNEGEQAATGIVINNPIPQNTVYLANTAAGDNSRILYSADSGENFAATAELRVIQDGKQRKARAEDITHIRWTLPGAVAPGASGSVEFSVRVK